MKHPVTSAIALLLILSPALRADLELHPLFTDHAVLQADQPVPVWGTARAGDSVTVEFARQSKSSEVKADGSWMVILDPLETNAEPATLTVSSAADILPVAEVLVGEVWVCSGQSNMAWQIRNGDDAALVETEANAGKYEHIRLFKAPINGTDERQSTVNASWSEVDASNASTFSATGFYFGRLLQKELGVPVGLIQSANGGTNAYSWINSETYQEDPVAEDARTHWAAMVKAHPEAMKRYEKAQEAWQKKVAAAREAGTKVEGRAPREPLGPNHVKRPSGHYNAMIAPLQPYAFQGAIWYQGEANSRPPFADGYRDLMFALIEDWRAEWPQNSGVERRDFPFLVVQLPNFGGGDAWGWPMIREQMLKIWQDGTNTGMAVSIDVGDSTDIHPSNKLPVGERLARFALGTTYEKDIVYSGPIYQSLMVDEGKTNITFDHAPNGLKTLDGEAPRHFTISGEDGTWYEATAEINGNTVTVSSPMVQKPIAVRYAWSNDPQKANLANTEDLPASPFRTDTAPILEP